MLSVFNTVLMTADMANQLVKNLIFMQGQLLSKCDVDDETYVKTYKKASFIGRKQMVSYFLQTNFWIISGGTNRKYSSQAWSSGSIFCCERLTVCELSWKWGQDWQPIPSQMYGPNLRVGVPHLLWWLDGTRSEGHIDWACRPAILKSREDLLHHRV